MSDTIEQTLSIIKPDAVERNLTDEIKNIFLKNKLNIKDSKKIEKKIEIPIGQGIVYNGDKVLHKVCKQSAEGQRITLVINLTTKTQSNFIGKFLQKCRNYTDKILFKLTHQSKKSQKNGPSLQQLLFDQNSSFLQLCYLQIHPDVQGHIVSGL